MAWKTSWSYAQRGTNFTYWNQKAFTYTFSNNLYGAACRLKYSNWYGKHSCDVAFVKLYIQEKEYLLYHNGKKAFSVTADRDIYSDKMDVQIRPGRITVEMEFASFERPESGNTFRPGVVMIVQSFEVLCEDEKDTEIGVVALFGDSITHWGYWTNPLITRMYMENPGRLAIFEVAINGSRLLNGSPKCEMDGLGYRGMTRFKHDVLSLEGISCCVFALGLNDLAIIEEAEDIPLTYESYISCVNEIVCQAHERHIKIIGLTICPRVINQEFTEDRNTLRKRINSWIMKEAPFDLSLDVAALVANKADTSLKREYDSGDGVHINGNAGEKIANIFTERMFESREEI